jgi:hypothetical protein
MVVGEAGTEGGKRGSARQKRGGSIAGRDRVALYARVLVCALKARFGGPALESVRASVRVRECERRRDSQQLVRAHSLLSLSQPLPNGCIFVLLVRIDFRMLLTPRSLSRLYSARSLSVCLSSCRGFRNRARKETGAEKRADLRRTKTTPMQPQPQRQHTTPTRV